MLDVLTLDRWPEELATVPAVLIHSVLPKPTLIHLSGRAPDPIFVSILLHGDEDVGLKAIQQVMAEYQNKPLPRAVSILVGNVQAASVGVRYLPDQPDYNRIWPGSELPDSPEHLWMRQVVEQMLERRVVASIDLHNNTGRNPHYACICSLNAEHLKLAGLFSDRVLYFQRPKGVQTQAFTPFCPSITCECGPIGDASGVQAAVSLLKRILALDESSDFRAQMPGVHPAVELYHTIATLRVLPAATLSFSSRGDTDLFLRPDLDRLNFLELPPGTELGVASRALHECVEVCDQAGRDVTDDFLYLQEDALCVKRAVLPSMFTTSIEAIRQDCVGYFMERMTIPASAGG